MPDDSDLPPIVHDEAGHRWVTTVDGIEGELTYRRRDDQLTLVHTGVPDELGGRGIAGKLVEAALDYARANDLTVDPQCPYARHWLEKHPDVAATMKLA